ncbi:hypothetical protein GCM10009544_51710 [Streptomyces stramineus]|uniref:Uncharacterized protein n=1 Tax=Streptomyces stramineus TaxID=173861 RepID=A0ABP3KNB2_9ACTN
MVTAVADATANPRTEIRLTRFPSSIVRLGDLAGAIVPLALASAYPHRANAERLVTEGTDPVGPPAKEVRVMLGRHTATLFSSVVRNP